MDGPGIESWWGDEIFCSRPDLPRGPTSILHNWLRVFPGVKLPGHGVQYQPHIVEVKERVELQRYSRLCACTADKRVEYSSVYDYVKYYVDKTLTF